MQDFHYCIYCKRSFYNKRDQLFCIEDGYQISLDREACESFEVIENLEDVYPEFKK